MASTTNPVFPPPTSKAITAAIALLILFVAAVYASSLLWFYRHLQQTSKLSNKRSRKLASLGRRKYILGFYGTLLFLSLLEIATGTWLLAQYQHVGRFSNVGCRDGIRLTLFCASWTLLLSTAFLVFLFNNALSQHILASIYAQAIWIIFSWAMWTAATATLRRALPLMSPKMRCAGADFCTQLQAVFGFALAQVIVLTIGMLVVTWLLWRAFFCAPDNTDTKRTKTSTYPMSHK